MEDLSSYSFQYRMKWGAPTKKNAFQGPYTKEDGFLGYNEVCEEEMDKAHPWTKVWEEYNITHRNIFIYLQLRTIPTLTQLCHS